MKHNGVCPSGKPGYEEEHDAERALGRVQSRRRRYGDKQGTRRGLRIENRTYYCPDCGLFHLTAMSRREVGDVIELEWAA